MALCHPPHSLFSDTRHRRGEVLVSRLTKPGAQRKSASRWWSRFKSKADATWRSLALIFFFFFVIFCLRPYIGGSCSRVRKAKIRNVYNDNYQATMTKKNEINKNVRVYIHSAFGHCTWCSLMRDGITLHHILLWNFFFPIGFILPWNEMTCKLRWRFTSPGFTPPFAIMFVFWCNYFIRGSVCPSVGPVLFSNV